jgi:hypothetical protein
MLNLSNKSRCMTFHDVPLQTIPQVFFLIVIDDNRYYGLFMTTFLIQYKWLGWYRKLTCQQGFILYWYLAVKKKRFDVCYLFKTMVTFDLKVGAFKVGLSR